MKGLELAESYYTSAGAAMIREKFSRYAHKIAAGLVGDGSECFGFDDEISQDHDWGPSFCLWLDREDYEAIGSALQEAYLNLPKEFSGYPARRESVWGGGRAGVFEIGQFYKRFIGTEGVPQTMREWLAIPETNLATVTNGRVFTDPSGRFSSIRNGLMAFYPEDVRLKRIAARCMTMAQAGQYNYLRCGRRNEPVAAQYAQMQFTDAAISIVFLLNKRYKPFYKWMHRALRSLPILGETVYGLLNQTATSQGMVTGMELYERNSFLIEQVCQHVVKELRSQGLSGSTSDFLLDHGPQVAQKIQDAYVKGINVWVG